MGKLVIEPTGDEMAALRAITGNPPWDTITAYYRKVLEHYRDRLEVPDIEAKSEFVRGQCRELRRLIDLRQSLPNK